MPGKETMWRILLVNYDMAAVARTVLLLVVLVTGGMIVGAKWTMSAAGIDGVALSRMGQWLADGETWTGLSVGFTLGVLAVLALVVVVLGDRLVGLGREMDRVEEMMEWVAEREGVEWRPYWKKR